MPNSISLVLPCLNAQEHIGAALESVKAQNYAGQLEVVVADGGSTDDTLKIVAGVDFARALSGTDGGIYQGFNRGIEATKNDIVGILNADDLLHDGALNRVDQVFSSTPGIDFVSGGVTSGDLSGGLSEVGPASLNTRPLSTEGILFGIPAINARFFHRSAFDRIGLFAPDAGIAADREFMLRLCRSALVGARIDEPLYHYRVHEGSTTIAADAAAQQRVWQAEIDLAGYLLSQANFPEDERVLVRRASLLSKLKRRFNAQYAGTTSQSADARIGADWAQAVPALLAWRKWRGKLSGY